MQVFDMKVHALEADGDCGLVTLRGSFHPIYTSQLFLRVLLSELSKFSIGQSYSLRAQEPVQVIETVPLDAVKSRFDDGSPVPEDAEAGVERRGGYRL